ncbi:hypothetical protein ACF3DV_00845 [Chlorogloeopsis fritschii PCC 9212]|jgi:hypothetical protein|uniref:Uncharacterized protein n=1 Tax=Chlorogloeopsis fritschii PCC 6912 TaxID=211165 RepID=A0A3S1A4T8_CHLFR|nr:hypothetical protein [Chlorogloeopsis fritschii]MBF2008102.1 hypothetical protein [Chlorogloeopsis fritschii C42_A2020_084]RUR80246.1 hypothetical protein PCC6912_31060 [Chlorogloeopsis fritschii PCC 6912]
MVQTVVVINVLISLTLLYVAWRVWQLRLRWTRITNWFILAERCSHAVLRNAPEAIYISQHKIQNLRQTNQVLEIQLQQLRQIISLLVFGQRIWRRYLRKGW